MKQLTIILSAVFALSVSAVAQNTLTLQQCRDKALESSNKTAIADATSQKYADEVKAYRSNYLPKISANGAYLFMPKELSTNIEGGYLPTFTPGADGTMQPNLAGAAPDGSPIFKEYAYFPGLDLDFDLNNTYTAGLKLEQPIYMGGKITTASRMAKVGKQIADRNCDLTRAQVLSETDMAYWNCVRAKEMLIAANKFKLVVDELKRNIANAHELGMKPQSDVLKVSVKFNEADLNVRRAENAIRLSRMNLCHVVGMPLDSDIDVTDSFSTDSLQMNMSDRNVDISSRAEYDILEKQVELKELEKRLTRSEYMPNIGVMAMYNYTNGVKMNGSKMFSDMSFAAILSISIPLFHWGEGAYKTRSAEADQSIMRLQQKDLQEQMTLEATQALNTLDEAQAEVEMTAIALQQAEENLRVSHDNYEVGMETLANYLEAQTIWQKAYAEWITSMTQMRYCETNFLRTTGRL